MTSEERTPRKRRRRRRRAQGQASPQGTGPSEPSREGEGRETQHPGSARPGRSRRRRSRHRGRHSEGQIDSGGEPESTPTGETSSVEGVLYVKPNGAGLLVRSSNNYVPQPGDPSVGRSIIDRNHLLAGLHLEGTGRRGGSGIELTQLEKVEGMPLAEFQESRRPFSELISVDPLERFHLETEPTRLTTRVLDLLAPLGKGQRCLVVAPPKAGKTTLLKDIAHGIEMNHPEAILIVLLVDERPEEVTDFRRSVEHGEVIASSSDETAENHITIAEVVLERARRLVELKHDVVILCDSITRMSRAYNNEQKSSGRIMSGGIDARTMEKPRRFFGSARNAEEWGSLTIVATALVDTGSRMDEVIFQEFKGTGNTEVVLDRGLFERRIFPAINIAQTGTR
ncbi:MAG TPA: transcription termination factor Rho, partial [Thermoanaerobaculia bacterium]|nr:transcription termination factor Rho [Thermoanaerobaculia bacterium]